MSPSQRQHRRSLRRRLTATFTALGVIGLLVVGVTGYTLTQWRASEDEQQRHYLRSLRLLEARALTFEAYKEVPDAVLGNDPNARTDYTERLGGIDAVFTDWAELAEDESERREVIRVREAASRLDDSAEQVFDLVDADRRDDALLELEVVEEEAFEPFDRITDAAVASDEAKREVVRSEASAARRTASITLVVAGVGTVSLLLLIGAFLAGGVFRPARDLHDALAGLAAGRTDVRLAEGPDDELGALSRDVNALAARLAEASGAPGPADPAGATGGEDGARADVQLHLARLVGGLADRVVELSGRLGEPEATELTAQVEAARLAVVRLGSLAHPVDLDLTTLEPMGLLHDVLGRVEDEVVRRSVSTRLHVAQLPAPVVADRARIREALSELVRNALDALPERGGSVELRAVDHAGQVALEVADDGPGFSPADVAWIRDGSVRPEATRGLGLRLAGDVVAQHGGRLQLAPGPEGHGTVARVLLPRHDRRKR